MAEEEEKKRSKIQKPRGTYDLFGNRLLYFRKVREICKEVAEAYGFRRMETPIFEKKELFTRGVGVGTDVVDKEMYTLEQGKNKLALRPEGTASIARAYIENGMNNRPKPVRLWHFGPFFRHERPQAGRYRQFWQFGVEVLGKEDPVIDAHTVQFFHALLKEIGFENLEVKINSIGCTRCRKRYIEDLKEYFSAREGELCKDCKRRLKRNPLRILDCKKKKCQEAINGAPQILDCLWKKCRVHLREVLEFLDDLRLPYDLDPFLVRGLDYYTRTVFEVKGKEDDLSLAGGGRYDVLVGKLGGRKTPGCGGAMGMERVVEKMREEGIGPAKRERPRVFLAQLGISAKTRALSLFEELRKKGVEAGKDFSCGSLSDQLGLAEEQGADLTVILAKKEMAEGEVIIRDMKKQKQEKVSLEEVVEEVKKRL